HPIACAFRASSSDCSDGIDWYGPGVQAKPSSVSRLEVVCTRRCVAWSRRRRAPRHGRLLLPRNNACPWPIVARRPRGGDLKLFSAAAQRHRPRAPPDLTVDHESGASRRRIARAHHQHSAAAILLKGFECLGDGDERAVMQLADATRRIHLIPSPSVASFGVRASASAASHSRSVNTSLPDLTMESRPLSPRNATAPPSAAISTSGWGALIIRITAPPIRNAPMKRKVVLKR